MPCPEALQVQAYVDGEVDALTSAAIERHLEQCAECRNLHQDVVELRTVLRQDLRYFQTPPALRAQVMRILDKEDAVDRPKPGRTGTGRWRTPAFWLGAGSGLGTAAVAATLALWLLAPPLTTPVIDEVVGAHVSSLMTTHLIDVVSTDQHTVKPWFAGHTDVSPVVADFESQGYKLVGGRVDYLEHQRAAVVVYRHGLHVINVFSWAGNQRGLPGHTIRNGFQLMFWRSGDLDYCAVSDTAPDELLGLVRLLQGLGAGGT